MVEQIESNNMREILSRIDHNEQWNPDEIPEGGRYAGADDLFMYIKKSMHRCAKTADDATMFDIFECYSFGLSAYCDLLREHIPRDEKKPVTARLIATTAKYCYDTLPSLETEARRINGPLKTFISVSDARDEFALLIEDAEKLG